MNSNPTPNKQRIILPAVILIVLALSCTAWLILRSSENGEPSEITAETESPAPVYNTDLTPGLSVVYALSDSDTANDSITDSFARNNFLKVLVSQLGSHGEIISSALSTYDYYTEWYIGGYEGKDGWSKATPWCASYVSWCLNQVSLSVKGSIPRYANVDSFMLYFAGDGWLSPDHTPTPGDLVFFGKAFDPNHMGVVIHTDETAIYTIEGNTADLVGVRKYPKDDGSILGYGVINWAS